MPPILILVVDDFGYWRHFIISMLEKMPAMPVICEASDGMEAVQKAEGLKPDLILLDIGLPVLNGIDAARQIRHRSPTSKILFFSQESDPEVAQYALKFGAGFVVKKDAGHELLSAVNIVMRGKRFVSGTLARPPVQQSSEGPSTIALEFEFGRGED
jgi:DNA-binding NarL/FixJ family response regulator